MAATKNTIILSDFVIVLVVIKINTPSDFFDFRTQQLGCA